MFGIISELLFRSQSLNQYLENAPVLHVSKKWRWYIVALLSEKKCLSSLLFIESKYTSVHGKTI